MSATQTVTSDTAPPPAEQDTNAEDTQNTQEDENLNDENNNDLLMALTAKLWDTSTSLREAGELPEELSGFQTEEELRVYIRNRLQEDNIDALLEQYGFSKDQLLPNTSEDTEKAVEKSEAETESSKTGEPVAPKTAALQEIDPNVRPYKDVLKDSAGTFVDCLYPTNILLNHLQNSSVLNNAMAEKVRCRPNRPDKVRVLLTFLMGLGPDSLTAFIHALRATDQESLANILAAQSFT